jgi:alpha-L-fucosidase 2
LAIAASRPGSQPMNLQGIWNDRPAPPWNANSTVNINTQRNYWPLLPCGLPELNLPLVEMLKDLAEAGTHTARTQYGAPGFCVHHNVDLWRHSAPVPGSASWSFFPQAGGWLCWHLFAHYEYTMDKDFLRQTAYPIMKQAARFFLHVLAEDKNGFLIFAPATSPENLFIHKGKTLAVAQTSTCAMAIIRDLLQNLQKSHQILGIDDAFAEKVRAALPRLLPEQIGGQGQLLEWYEEFEEAEPKHRHVSHLFGLYPAARIHAERTPALFAAARRSLTLRGDEGTGWSLGWKINLWARLREGDRALRLLNMQLRPAAYSKGGGSYPNLMDAHPPFQIDGNFGAVSGMNEMLAQCDGETLELLPALPAAWPKGSARGLRVRGGATVDLTWENGRLTDARVSGGGHLRVLYQGQEIHKK